MAGAVFSQLIFVLFVLPTISGSSDVFRVVGVSVQLDVNGSVSEFDYFTWVFSGSDNVLQYSKRYKDVTPSTRYKHRVEFVKETCSLTLKKLKKTDSGLYEVKASNTEKTTTLCAHRLSVLDPVEAPVLTVYNSTDPCNITINCRGHDLSITSTCYKETCEEKEVTSSGGVALSLSVRDGVIICNHSNPVSWKQDKITFTHLCPDTGTEYMEVHSGSHWTGILITVCFLVFLGFLVVVYRRIKPRRAADVKQMENFLYAEVERNDQPSSPETETYSTVYSTVTKHPAFSK